MGLKVAIVGATGAVGRQMLADLAMISMPLDSVRLFASERSAGTRLAFRGRDLECEAYSVDSLRGIDVVLMSAGGAFSKAESRKLVALGCVVIDNSSAWRMDDSVPLVVPEVNPGALEGFRKGGIIANPNCSTIQLVVALEPVRKAFGLEMVVVATYQSCSGAGQKGIEELWGQTGDVMNGKAPILKKFLLPIAFNVIPAIDRLVGEGHCFEEEKMVRETRKILGLAGLEVMATTARVPTLRCHAEAVTIRLGHEVSRAQLLDVLRTAPGIVLDEGDEYAAFPHPRSVSGDSATHVSRVRLSLDCERSRWAQMWVVADNLKKGAATNAIQIMELLVSRRLL